MVSEKERKTGKFFFRTTPSVDKILKKAKNKSKYVREAIKLKSVSMFSEKNPYEEKLKKEGKNK